MGIATTSTARDSVGASSSSWSVVYSYLTTTLFFFCFAFDHGNRSFSASTPWLELFHPERAMLLQRLGLGLMLKIFEEEEALPSDPASGLQEAHCAALGDWCIHGVSTASELQTLLRLLRDSHISRSSVQTTSA
eukprot:jgi/Psemu1/40019/gm1.40019_g